MPVQSAAFLHLHLVPGKFHQCQGLHRLGNVTFEAGFFKESNLKFPWENFPFGTIKYNNYNSTQNILWVFHLLVNLTFGSISLCGGMLPGHFRLMGTLKREERAVKSLFVCGHEYIGWSCNLRTVCFTREAADLRHLCVQVDGKICFKRILGCIFSCWNLFNVKNFLCSLSHLFHVQRNLHIYEVACCVVEKEDLV